MSSSSSCRNKMALVMDTALLHHLDDSAFGLSRLSGLVPQSSIRFQIYLCPESCVNLPLSARARTPEAFGGVMAVRFDRCVDLLAPLCAATPAKLSRKERRARHCGIALTKMDQ